MSVPAVASAAVAAAVSRSSHHKESIRRGPAGSVGKQVRTHTCVSTHTYTPYTFSTPRKWQGILRKEKRQPRKGFSFTAGNFRRATGSSCSSRSRPQWNISPPDSPFSTRQTTSGKERYRAFEVLSGTSATY